MSYFFSNIKSETISYYNKLKLLENAAFDPPSKIYLHLYNEEKISYSIDNTVHLYWIEQENSPLYHELTHVFFGIRSDHVTQEGLAIYVQDNYSNKKVFPNYQADIHSIMNYLLSNNIYIPLDRLLESDGNFNYSNLDKDSYALRWLSYIESGSFSRYLIDKYGIVLFLKIYGKSNISNEINLIYGKKLEQLEEEWKNDINDDNNLNIEKIQKYNSQLPGIINHLQNNKEEILP